MKRLRPLHYLLAAASLFVTWFVADQAAEWRYSAKMETAASELREAKSALEDARREHAEWVLMVNSERLVPLSAGAGQKSQEWAEETKALREVLSKWGSIVKQDDRLSPSRPREDWRALVEAEKKTGKGRAPCRRAPAPC